VWGQVGVGLGLGLGGHWGWGRQVMQILRI
jgi:hypothetical protein